ncbi:uncharacterized protein KZ484_006554 isoform 2-T2 [Pholidichthys leucotaenia]
MDEYAFKRLSENSMKYKMSLDRIIEKYSKLQYQDGAMEVDLNDIRTDKVLEEYMTQSEKVLKQLESKSLADLKEESLRADDITGESQLDLTCQDGGADETVSSVPFNNGMIGSDATKLTVSSLDESGRNLSEVEFQPEDQDEELEMTLRSHGSSLVELYPGMISRIEQAWHRQSVSKAADSVRRRYHRWRQLSNRSNANTTFVVELRHSDGNKKRPSEVMSPNRSGTPVKGQLIESERTPPRVVTARHSWGEQNQSAKERGSVTKEPRRPILVMDFSDLSETSNLNKISANEAITKSLLTPPKLPIFSGQVPNLTVSPLQSCNLTAKILVERLSLPVPETTTVKQRSDIYGSAIKNSPLKANDLSRSPQMFSRTLKENMVERHARSLTSSLCTPPRNPAVSQRLLYPQNNSHQSPQPQLYTSPSVSTPGNRHQLRRHFSFDSSLPTTRSYYSPKEVDEDFIKLYHKFVCQNKSTTFNGPPCRFCARNSETSRSQSSSALAALALSPHRSVLRKRCRELQRDSHPQSKRIKDTHYTYSPESKRHQMEMLRRSLSPSELEHPYGGLSHSPSKRSMFLKFRPQQPPAQELNWSPQDQATCAGSSLESTVTLGYSPRKWQ